jgi:transcriptional regulator with XRE-family HTH domain
MDNGYRHSEFSDKLRLTQRCDYDNVTLTAISGAPMNTDFFSQLLSARKLSQRGLAKLMDLDPGAVSLMLRGKRKMTNAEAHQLSTILGVGITEVLRQAGIEVRDDVRYAKVTGYIDSDALVTLFPSRTHDKVIGPADCPEGTYALQKRTPNSPQDGWMYFVSPSEDDPRAHLGKLCCIALENGEHVVAFVQRGYRTGTFNLIRCTGVAQRTDANVVWASPVLWIKPL